MILKIKIIVTFLFLYKKKGFAYLILFPTCLFINSEFILIIYFSHFVLFFVTFGIWIFLIFPALFTCTYLPTIFYSFYNKYWVLFFNFVYISLVIPHLMILVPTMYVRNTCWRPFVFYCK